MTLDYKQVVKITGGNIETGVLKYEVVYKIPDDINTEVTKIRDTLKITDRVPGPGDKMYFLNGVTVPRFKIKRFCNEKGPKVVKYIESTNLAIIGKTTIKEYFTTEWLYEIRRESIIEYLSNWIINNNTQKDKDEIYEDETWALELSKILEKTDINLWFKRSNYKFGQYLEDINVLQDDYARSNFVTADSYSRLQKILNLTCDIIDESTILKQLNSTVVMDTETYESIQKLMESSDKENMKIAMELMSNCDYDNSAMYLLLLLKKYSSKISNMGSKHHVNFKALLNYFGFNPNSNFNSSVDEIIDILKKRKLLVPNQLDILIPLILENYDPDSTHYKVSNVKFFNDDGSEIIVEELPEINEIEYKTEEEVCSELYGVNNNPEVNIEVKEPEDEIEMDAIVYDELSEVIKYCLEHSLLDNLCIIQHVRDLGESSNKLLPIIEYMDETGANEQATLLIQCYLSIP